MDAWLFNAGMIQLASVGVSYFLSLSFTLYARLSANNGKSQNPLFPKKVILTTSILSHLQLVRVQHARLALHLVAVVLGADWPHIVVVHLFRAETRRLQKATSTHALEAIEEQVRDAALE